MRRRELLHPELRSGCFLQKGPFRSSPVPHDEVEDEIHDYTCDQNAYDAANPEKPSEIRKLLADNETEKPVENFAADAQQ
jgi:hypothetical protein